MYLQKIYLGFFPNIYTFISEYHIGKVIVCLLLNRSLTNRDIIVCHEKILWVHAPLSECWRGTC